MVSIMESILANKGIFWGYSNSCLELFYFQAFDILCDLVFVNLFIYLFIYSQFPDYVHYSAITWINCYPHG